MLQKSNFVRHHGFFIRSNHLNDTRPTRPRLGVIYAKAFLGILVDVERFIRVVYSIIE